MSNPLPLRRIAFLAVSAHLIASGTGCRSAAPNYGSPNCPRQPYIVRRPPVSPPVPRRGVVINNYAGFNYNRRTPIATPPATLISPDDTASTAESTRF